VRLIFLVQFVEDDVGQERRKRAALRQANAGRAQASVALHRATQKIGNEIQKPDILHALGEALHKANVVHIVEEFLNIEIYNPMPARFQTLLGEQHGVQRRPAFAVGETGRGEVRLPDWREHLGYGLQHHTVLDRGNVERAGAAQVSFGPFDCAQGAGPVTPPRILRAMLASRESRPCSKAPMVTPSMPGAPRLRCTRCQAQRRLAVAATI